ncbi:MAG: cupin domain-containing protein [Phycisphaeraceae bacterium]|nr:cupin domain-containing protein [Phycisphaeraceae bacterium]
MFIRHSQQVPPQAMTLPGARGVAMRLLVGRADGAPTFGMRLFEVEPGGCTPFHQHNYEHEILVLEGAGQVFGGLDGSTIRPIQAGDVVFMPPNEKHQFRNVSTQPLKFLCLIPVSFDCGNGTCQPTPGC